MGVPLQPSVNVPVPVPGSDHRERWLIRFSMEGDLRFLSHQDTLRLFQRALARAALPVRYSEGFNPHARVSIPLPRPVGIASGVEAMVTEFDRLMGADAVLRKLREQLPAGMVVHEAKRLAPREQSRPVLVRYGLELPHPPPAVEERARELLAAGAIPMERVYHREGKRRVMDVRPYLADIQVDHHGVTFGLNVTPSGSLKPAEVLELLGLEARSCHHRLRRIEIQWQSDRH